MAKEGPLPVGAHTWRVLDLSVSRYVDGTLTVGLLVRSPLPCLAACASLSHCPPLPCPARETPVAQLRREKREGKWLRP